MFAGRRVIVHADDDRLTCGVGEPRRADPIGGSNPETSERSLHSGVGVTQSLWGGLPALLWTGLVRWFAHLSYITCGLRKTSRALATTAPLLRPNGVSARQVSQH